jgi:hypothetical protein
MAILNRTGARARGRGVWPLAAALSLALAGPTPVGAADGPSLEYAVKANYLYKFGPFVDWPEDTFTGPAAPFNVCIAGEDPFGAALDEAIKGQSVQGRPVAVRRLTTVAGESGCQVLYLGRSKTQTTVEALRVVRAEPVLTVTDERLGGAGGIVHFVLRDGRVGFSLNPAAAQSAGLTLSSKLLALSVGPGR